MTRLIRLFYQVNWKRWNIAKQLTLKHWRKFDTSLYDEKHF